jgi:hypothetical protein
MGLSLSSPATRDGDQSRQLLVSYGRAVGRVSIG